MKGVKLRAKQVCSWANFARTRRLHNKDQEIIQQGSGGYTTRIRRLYNKDQEVIGRIFLVLVLLSASVQRYFVSRMGDFVTAFDLTPTLKAGPKYQLSSGCLVV